MNPLIEEKLAIAQEQARRAYEDVKKLLGDLDLSDPGMERVLQAIALYGMLTRTHGFYSGMAQAGAHFKEALKELK